MFANQKGGTDKLKHSSYENIKSIASVAIGDRGRMVLKWPVVGAARTAVPVDTALPIFPAGTANDASVDASTLKGSFSQNMIDQTNQCVHLPIGKVYKITANICTSEQLALYAVHLKADGTNSIATHGDYTKKQSITCSMSNGSNFTYFLDTTDTVAHPVTGTGALTYTAIKFHMENGPAAINHLFDSYIVIEELASI